MIGRTLALQVLAWVCHACLAAGMLAAMLFSGAVELAFLGLPVVLGGCAAVAAGVAVALGGGLPVVGWRSLGLIVVAAGYFVWRIATSPVADLARYDLQLLAGGCCVWASVRLAPVDWRIARTIWVVLALAVAGHAVVAVYQFWVDPTFTPIYGGRPASGFGSGFYARYNDLGPFLAAALMPLLALVGWPGVRGWLRVVAGLLGGLALAGLFASQARSSVVALGGALVVLAVIWLLWPRGPAGKRVLLLVVAIPVVVGGGWALTATILNQRGAGENPSDMLQYNERLFYAGMAIEQIAERPWLGSGSQSYSYIHPRFWPQRGWGASRNPRWVHNEFLQTAGDYGLIGLGLLLASLGALWVGGAITPVAAGVGESAECQALRAGALAAMVALGLGGLFSFIFHLLPTLMTLAFLAALVIPRAPADPRSAVRWPLAGALVAIGALAIPGGAREARVWWAARALWHNPSPTEKRAALEASVRISPTYAGFFVLATDLLAEAAEEPSPQVRHAMLLKADGYLKAAMARHPEELEIVLNRANLLDGLGRFAEADPLHARIAAVGDPRETWWRGHYHRGRHFHLWGRSLWNARRPEEALWLLQRARAEFIRSNELAPYPAAWPGAGVIKDNAAAIEFLETARVAPSPPAELLGK
jgi:O-antigen ligase